MSREVLVSGLVWLATGIIALRFGDRFAFTAMFVGGVAIWPLSLLIAYTMLRVALVGSAPLLGLAVAQARVALMVGAIEIGVSAILFVRWKRLTVQA